MRVYLAVILSRHVVGCGSAAVEITCMCSYLYLMHVYF
jgi:hypothetical protein